MSSEMLRTIVSRETLARLEAKMPPAEVDKLLFSIAQTMSKKLQNDKPETLPLGGDHPTAATNGVGQRFG